MKVEVWKDLALPSGVRLQTTRNLDVQERRPNQLRVEVRSPRVNQGFWYDGKAVTMLDRVANVYGVMETPETIDKAIDAVEEQFGVEIPLCDVLVADPYRNLMENVEAGVSLGRSTVLGTPCHHLAFTGVNADFQIWIAEGPRPLPRKIVINLRGTGGLRQITQIFSDWDLVTPVADETFTFVAPEGAGKVTVNPKKTEDPAADAPAAATETPAKQ